MNWFGTDISLIPAKTQRSAYLVAILSRFSAKQKRSGLSTEFYEFRYSRIGIQKLLSSHLNQRILNLCKLVLDLH